MRVGIVGSGRIGGTIGGLLSRSGHEVVFSFSRDDRKLAQVAAAAGGAARVGTPRDAGEFADVVVLSVPWNAVEAALAATGPLDGKVVIDTTNPYGGGKMVSLGGLTSAQYNQRRIGGASLVKAFNTLTVGFQAKAAGRTGPDRVAMFYVCDDADAGKMAAELISDVGFVPVSLGGLADSQLLEAPRRPGAVYGEEYHEPQAITVAALWQHIRRIDDTAHRPPVRSARGK